MVPPVEIFSLSDGEGGAILRTPYTDEAMFVTPSELSARINPGDLSLDDLFQARRQIAGATGLLAAVATDQRLRKDLDEAIGGLARESPSNLLGLPPHVDVEIQEPLTFADGTPGRWSFPLRVRWREPGAPGPGDPVVLSYASPVARHEAIEMTRALPKILSAEDLDVEVAPVGPVEGTPSTLRAMPFERSGLLTVEEAKAKVNEGIPRMLASIAEWSPQPQVDRIHEIIHRKFANEDSRRGHFRSADGNVYEILVTPFFDRIGNLRALGPIQFRPVSLIDSRNELADRTRVEEVDGKLYRSFAADVEPDLEHAAVLAEAVRNATNRFSERVGGDLIPKLEKSDRGPHELSRNLRDRDEVFAPNDHPSGPEGVQSSVNQARTRFDGVAWDLFRPNDEGFFLTKDGVVLHYGFHPEDLRLSPGGQPLEYNPRILAFPEFDEYAELDARNLEATIEWTSQLREPAARRRHPVLGDLAIMPAFRSDDGFRSPSLEYLDLRPLAGVTGSFATSMAQGSQERITAAVHELIGADEYGRVRVGDRDVPIVVEVLFDAGGAARALLPVRVEGSSGPTSDDLPPAAE